MSSSDVGLCWVPQVPDEARVQAIRAPLNVRTQFTREVEAILDKHLLWQSKKNQRFEFLVKWKGLLDGEASWERDVTIWKYEGLVQELMARSLRRTWGSHSGGGLSSPQLGACILVEGNDQQSSLETSSLGERPHDAPGAHKLLWQKDMSLLPV
ncbi:hypothetical protein AMTR_s00065p00133660 [Amborella trichopoda]|uniref:Chromo domain-containing protein n=1 Tax=Amborella trichopoda TaxID=13333 RepID=U5D801_AMBTC|nr:hypothetical protein AMTR_s00065p00133660 [Amborella trichopoda]